MCFCKVVIDNYTVNTGATAEFSPLGESSITSVSSLVAPKRFKSVRYGSGCGLANAQDIACQAGTEEQATRFLDVVKGDRFAALYALALTTGMREGELLGLRWQDIDLENMTLYVRMDVQAAVKGFILAETKTAYSRRSRKLSKLAVAALWLHAARQAGERKGLAM
jgi:integrase